MQPRRRKISRPWLSVPAISVTISLTWPQGRGEWRGRDRGKNRGRTGRGSTREARRPGLRAMRRWRRRRGKRPHRGYRQVRSLTAIFPYVAMTAWEPMNIRMGLPPDSMGAYWIFRTITNVSVELLSFRGHAQVNQGRLRFTMYALIEYPAGVVVEAVVLAMGWYRVRVVA